MFVAKFRDWYATLRLLQYPHNLRILYRLFFIQNLLRKYAAKMLRVNTTNLRENYQ